MTSVKANTGFVHGKWNLEAGASVPEDMPAQIAKELQEAGLFSGGTKAAPLPENKMAPEAENKGGSVQVNQAAKPTQRKK